MASLGHPRKFQRVSHLGSVTAQHSRSGRQPNCGAEQRAQPVVGRAAITLGINPHSSSIFFSLPNLSSRRLDGYHILTHDVGLVRILNAGLKCAAHGSLKIQDPKNRHMATIAQLCRAISSHLRHVSTTGKKLVKQQCLPHMSSQYGELRPTSG